MVLVGYWPLDEETGDAIDYSGNGNDGSLSGGVTQGATGILNDTSYSFDGSDDHISVTFDLPTLSFSYTFWFSPPSDWSPGTGREDFYYGSSGTSARPHITFDRAGNGKIGIFVTIDGTNYDDVKTSTSNWSSNDWYLISFTWDGSNFDVYVNGQLENTIQHSGTHKSQNSFDLASSNGDDIGKLQHFRIYNHALTAQEVQYLYSVSSRGLHTSDKRSL